MLITFYKPKICLKSGVIIFCFKNYFIIANGLKKTLYILFALFYLTLSSKVNASVHFCGGSITDISFFEHGNDDACDCGKLADNSCCKDFTIKCQVNDDQSNLVKTINLNNSSYKLLGFVWQKITFNTFSCNFNKNTFTEKDGFIPPLILTVLSGIFLRI